MRRATLIWRYLTPKALKFLSTLSLRRATPEYFLAWHRISISIHALLAESDQAQGLKIPAHRDFYPRSPCGERRARRASRQQPEGISIHALLAESDNCTSIGRPKRLYFYPRSPCGERQPAEHHANSQKEFLSTLSLRRATRFGCGNILVMSISIHALLAESDRSSFMPLDSEPYFYPRSPCGERLASSAGAFFASSISIHALLAESDVTVLGIQHKVGISIHALLAESDCSGNQQPAGTTNFYPRSPCGERPEAINPS